jgi:hypothetical protein
VGGGERGREKEEAIEIGVGQAGRRRGAPWTGLSLAREYERCERNRSIRYAAICIHIGSL